MADETDETDGTDDTDDTDETDGTDDTDDTDGTDGTDETDGTDGTDDTDDTDGTDDTDDTDETDDTDDADETDETDGTDGTDETDDTDGTDDTDDTDETDETDDADETDGTDETDDTDGTDDADETDETDDADETDETGGAAPDSGGGPGWNGGAGGMDEKNTNAGGAVMRNMVLDFLDVSGGKGAPDWQLMGHGFTSLNETSGAQTEQRAYISDASPSNIVRGYETEFPFATDLMTKQPVIDFLYGVGRNHRRGADAETGYVRVEAFADTGVKGVYPARRFLAACEVADITGEGAQHMEISGSLKPVGDFAPGAFDMEAREFAEGEEGADGTVTVTVRGKELRLRDGLWPEKAAGA